MSSISHTGTYFLDLLGYLLGKPLLEPSVAHLQRGHLELAAVQLAEALGDHLPGQLLLYSELEQQIVIMGHDPSPLIDSPLPPL